MKRAASAFLAASLSACASGGLPGPADPYLAAMPPGQGREILADACTVCHDLGGIEAYKGYWGERQWRDMVVTMVEHGAELESTEADVLVDYLTLHFGPGAP